MSRTFHDALAELQQIYDRQVTDLSAANKALCEEIEKWQQSPRETERGNPVVRDHHMTSYVLPVVPESKTLERSPTTDQTRPGISLEDNRCGTLSSSIRGDKKCYRVKARLAAAATTARLSAAASSAAFTSGVMSAISQAKNSADVQPLIRSFSNPTWRCLQRWVDWEGFDIFFGFVIIGNAITIGIDTSARLGGDESPHIFVISEYLFLALYAIELVLRYITGGLNTFRSDWVKFDLFLVICGFIDVVVGIISDGQSIDVLDKILLVRILRLVRIARIFRLVVQFRTLWVLVKGLMESVMTLFWTFVLMVIMIYTFAVFAVELLKPDDNASEAYNIAIQENFGSLINCCLTLCQGLTLDSIGAIYRPIIIEKWYMSIYFIVFIMLVSIALMNLVTAVLVESTLSFEAEDKEISNAFEAAKRKALLAELHQLFTDLDRNKAGILTLDELEHAAPNVRDHLRSILNLNDPELIFNTLDICDDGAVGIDEFCEGILALLEGTPMELISIVQQLSVLRHEIRDGFEELQHSGKKSPRSVRVVGVEL